MAKIHPYEREVLPQGALPMGGTEAIAAAGEATGRGFLALGAGGRAAVNDLQEVKVQEDVTAVYSAMSKAQLDWQTTFAERMKNAQPGDKTLVPQLQQDMTKYFADMKATVATRQGQAVFDRQAGELMTHFTGKALVGQAELDGLKARQDFTNMVGNAAANLISDPTGYAQAVAKLDAAVNDPDSTYARLSATDKIKLVAGAKESLFEGMIRGLVDNGAPALARKKLMDGEGDGVLNEDSKKKLIGEADAAIRSKEALDRAARAEAKVALQEARDDQLDKYMRRLYSPSKENGGLPSYKEIMDDTILDPRQKEHLALAREHRANKLADNAENVKHPQAVRDLFHRITADDGTPGKIYGPSQILEAEATGKISMKEAKELVAYQAGWKDYGISTIGSDAKRAQQRAERNIGMDLMMRLEPAKATEAQNQLSFDLQDAIRAKMKKDENPRELLDPNSKEYFFTPSRMQTYFGTLQQQLGTAANKEREAGRKPAAALPQYSDSLAPGTHYIDPQGRERIKR